MTAPAPTRSSGSLTIQFGLVSVPVQLFSSVDADASKVTRQMRTEAGNPVKFINADATTGEVINRSDTHYVYVKDDGTEVPLSDEEIAEAMGENNGDCHVVGFYPMDELSKYTTESLAQVRPATTKSGKNTLHPYDKPFALLMAALAVEDAFALIRYTLRGKPRLGALTSDGTLRVLHFADEIREARPMPEVPLSADELAMAQNLIGLLMENEAPLVENDAIQKVRTYVDAKAAGVTVTEPIKVKAETTDLMAALAASVAAAKAA